MLLISRLTCFPISWQNFSSIIRVYSDIRFIGQHEKIFLLTKPYGGGEGVDQSV